MRLNRKEKGEDGVVLINTFPSTSFSPGVRRAANKKESVVASEFSSMSVSLCISCCD
jgi:hypothetical protein